MQSIRLEETKEYWNWKSLHKDLPFEYWFTRHSKDWCSARKEFMRKGGDLGGFKSELEVFALEKHLGNDTLYFYFYWTGLTDFNDDALWTWTGGNILNSSLVALDDVTHITESKGFADQCAVLIPQKLISIVSGNVTDLQFLANNSKFLEEHKIKNKIHLEAANCGKKCGFVCKRPIPHTRKRTSLPSDWRYFLPKKPKVTVTQCPKDSIDIGTKCINIATRTIASGLDWKESVKYCKQTYGTTSTLASLRSESELLSVAANVQTTNTYWTGGYRGDFHYFWTDNSPIADEFIQSRLNEDNKTFSDFVWFYDDKQCQYLDPLTSKFAFDNCSIHRGFICQTGVACGKTTRDVIPMLA